MLFIEIFLFDLLHKLWNLLWLETISKRQTMPCHKLIVCLQRDAHLLCSYLWLGHESFSTRHKIDLYCWSQTIPNSCTFAEIFAFNENTAAYQISELQTSRERIISHTKNKNKTRLSDKSANREKHFKHFFQQTRLIHWHTKLWKRRLWLCQINVFLISNIVQF